MSFCVSHRTALDKNIRHLYSGVSTDVRFRNYSNSTDAAMDIHDRICEHNRRPPNRFEAKFLEYNQDYKARMPRAPAFRQANAEEVHEITSRLTRPTLMTVLRQQPAVPSRASSSSPGPTSSRKTERSDSETPDLRHRKISYKEWSDDGSDVYYIEDSFLEDSSTSHKKEDNSGDSRNECNSNEERESLISYPQQPHEKPIQAKSREESQKRPSSNRVDSSDGGNDTENAKDDKEEKQEINSHSPWSSASQSENPTSETQQRKGQSKKQKLNILEEIIQTRNQIRHRNVHAQKAPSPSPIRERRKLENRGRINNKLSRSPYSEPVPCLGGRPLRYQRQGNSSKRNQPRIPSPGAKMSDSSDYRESQECPSSSAVRPQTQASISRPRRDRLTSQYRPESRGAAVYLRPTRRSKSAPGYTIHDDRRGIPKKREIHSNSNDNDNDKNAKTTRVPNTPSKQSNDSKSAYRRSQNELEENSDSNNDSVVEMTRQGRRMRHQSSKSAKAAATKRETSSAKPRSQSVMASRPIEVSKQHSPRNPDDVRYTQCCVPAVENDLLVRFGVEPKGQRPFYVSNSNRRYASAAEMEAASRRLLAPTAAKLIRDRMRWAPNNDNDLADPVKVIRETVARKSRKRKSGSNNETAWDNFDMDSDEQREEDEGKKNNSYRDYRLTDKEAGGRGKHSNSKESHGRHCPKGRFIRNNKDDRDDENHHDDDKTYTDRDKAAPTTIDFKDRQGGAAITKQRGHEGKGRSTTNASRANGRSRSRSRSISLSSKSGSSSRSRSTSRARSSHSNSRSRSRSRSTSASKSRSRSRSRSRSAHRSRSRERSSRSRSSERSTSQRVSGGYTQTEPESGEDVKPKAGFKASAERLSSGEERGEEHWTPQGQGYESSEKRDHSTTQQHGSNHSVNERLFSPDDPSASGENLESDTSFDVHRANLESSPEERPGSTKPLASASLTSTEVGEDRSRGEDGNRTPLETRSDDFDTNRAQDNGDERAGDGFFSRGQENENRGQERAYAQINVRDSEDGRNATQNSLHSSRSDDPGILYSVQKGYALETDGRSSYHSTDYNADVSDAEEGATRSAYHRVTFHDDR